VVWARRPWEGHFGDSRSEAFWQVKGVGCAKNGDWQRISLDHAALQAI